MPFGAAIAAVAGGLEAAGIGATLAGIAATGIVGAGTGALVGGAISGLEGGDIGKGALRGAETGAVTGGLGAAGGALGGSLIGGSLATGIGGALGGIAGGELLSGGKESPLGILGSAFGGYTGASAAGAASATGAGAGAVGGAGAAGTAGGAGIDAASGALPSDLTTSGDALVFGGSPATSPSSFGGGIGSDANAVASVNGTLGITPSATPATGSTDPFSFGASSAGDAVPAGSSMGTLPLSGTPTAPPAAPGGVDGVLKGLGLDPASGVGKAVSSVAGSKYAIPGAGLLFNAVEQGKQTGAEKALATQAATANAQGSMMQNYLTSGTLPPGAQAALDQATKAAKANIISRYAQRGMSTDPTQNSSLQQELAAVDTNASAQTFQLADQLFTQGISGTQLSGQLYQNIIANQRASNQDLSNAIAEFAAAASGGTRVGLGKGVNINIPGATTGG